MRWRAQVVAVVTVSALATSSVTAVASPRGAARATALHDVAQHLGALVLPTGSLRVPGTPAPAPFAPFAGMPPTVRGAPYGPEWRFADWIVPQADAKAVLAQIVARPPAGARVSLYAPNNVAGPGDAAVIEHSAILIWPKTSILTGRDMLVSTIARRDGTTAVEGVGEEFWSLPFYPDTFATLGPRGTLALTIAATGRHRVTIVVRDTGGRVLATAVRAVDARSTLVHIHLPDRVAGNLRRRTNRVIRITTRQGARHTSANVAYRALRVPAPGRD